MKQNYFEGQKKALTQFSDYSQCSDYSHRFSSQTTYLSWYFLTIFCEFTRRFYPFKNYFVSFFWLLKSTDSIEFNHQNLAQNLNHETLLRSIHLLWFYSCDQSFLIGNLTVMLVTLKSASSFAWQIFSDPILYPNWLGPYRWAYPFSCLCTRRKSVSFLVFAR